VTSDDPTGADVPTAPAVPRGTDDPGRLAAAQAGLRLLEVVREVEKHVAQDGWDQNPRLFALAVTADLVAMEPELAETLGTEHGADELTPIEQELVDRDQPLDELLATTEWPDDVAGAVLVIERLVLPPDAEESLPDDDRVALEDAAAAHPERKDVRMVVAVTRDGRRMCALRLRSHDSDEQVLVGEELVPRLADALRATFV
jgi:hypothetical protein